MNHLFSSIEILEPRIAPAALTAKLLGGLLKIVGDPAAATVTITQTGSSIEVLDGATSLGIFTGAKSIGATIVGGATVNVSLTGGGLPGPCKIAATATTTVNIFSGSHLDGGLSFSGDLAAQTLNVMDNVTIGKGLMFKGGDGADTISIGNGGTIGGNLTLTSVESGSFNATSTATGIAGSFVALNAGDLLPVSLQGNGNAGLSIGGGVTYVGGKAGDSFFLVATVTKGATYIDTLGDNSFGLGINSVVHGSVTVAGGVGSDTFGIQAGTIDGNVTLKLGSGNNNFRYGIGGAVTIGGNVNFLAGNGNDLWQGSGGLLTVGKNVTVKLGDGTNTVGAGVNISGTKLSITTGSGADIVSLDGTAGNIAAIIALGAGNDQLAGTLLDTVKTADFNGGAGMDHLYENTFVADPFVLRSFENLT